jgi:cytoskeletal protein CcmA (bactofilin family)
MAEQAKDRGLPFKPAQSLEKSADQSGPGDLSRPGHEVVHTSRPQAATQSSRGNEVDVRTMIVGLGTSFSGEIAYCNRLIVEGTIEAKLNNCQHMIIEESGVFRGNSSTDNADVHGSVEGNLVVRKRLLIRATGRVSGAITYGEIEIERGGKISGAIQADGDGAISGAGRAAAAKALGMNGRRRKSANPRDYAEN